MFWPDIAKGYIMSLDRVLSIIAVLLGVSGSILLGKGTLKLSARAIARMSQTYWGYNSLELRSLTSQKADFICGVLLIIIAFLVQLANLLFVQDSPVTYQYFDAVLIISVVGAPLVGIVFFVNRRLTRKYTIDSFKFLAQEGLQENIKRGKISKQEYQDHLRKAAGMFEMTKREEESPTDFLDRYSDFLGLEIPADTDMNELETDVHSSR